MDRVISGIMTLGDSRFLDAIEFRHQILGSQMSIAPYRIRSGKAGTEIEPFKWLNVLLGNLKTTLSGTHHSFGFSK